MSYFQLRKLVYIWILFYFAGSLSAQRWTPEDDFKHIKTFDKVLKKTVNEISQISPIEKDNIQYFTNKQYDQIERLYFRYNLCIRSLFDIINEYKDLSSESRYKKSNVPTKPVVEIKFGQNISGNRSRSDLYFKFSLYASFL